MGAASYLEDLEDRRIEGQILQGVAQFEEHQRRALRQGTLSEDSLQRDLETLRRRIVEPLEAIKEKVGAQGLDLGNQLLKLQAEINAASSAMEKLLGRIGVGPRDSPATGDTLAQFLDNFVNQYRVLLRVLQVTAQPLSGENRRKLDVICGACERDVFEVKGLSQRLAAREQGIALLYRKVQEMQKQLDLVQEPGMRALDGAGYDDFEMYTVDMNIKRLRR